MSEIKKTVDVLVRFYTEKERKAVKVACAKREKTYREALIEWAK